MCIRAAAAAAVAVTAAAAAASVCTDSAHRQETHAAKARTFLQFSCRHYCKQTSREASGFSELLHLKKKEKKKEKKEIPMFPHNYYFGKIPNEAADPGVYFTLSLV